MFKSARIKLTLWYLLIIALISVFFSLLIYKQVSKELERGFRRAEIRMRAKELGIPLPNHFSERPESLPLRLRKIPRFFYTKEELQSAKSRLMIVLLVLNGIILTTSALTAYFLAGKTLDPIRKMTQQQQRFITDASHELRTPLTALRTSFEVALRDKKINLSKAKNVIKEGLEEIESLQKLTNRLLNLSYYQNRNQALKFEEVEIENIIKKAYQKILPFAQKKGVRIELRINKQKIWGNKEALEEMMLIFLDNAIKYNLKGGKVILTNKKDKNNLILEIKDTGIGISEKDLPHIFDRFYRAERSRTKEKTDGFGLGLSLAKEIIDLHKGEVRVKSTVGKGTVVTIKLPLELKT